MQGTGPTDTRQQQTRCATAYASRCCECFITSIMVAVVSSQLFDRHALDVTSGSSVIGRFSAGHRRGDTYQNPTHREAIHPNTCTRPPADAVVLYHVAPALPLQHPGDSHPRNRRWLPHPHQILLESAPTDWCPWRLPRPDSVQDSKGPEGLREGTAGCVREYRRLRGLV